MRLLNFKSNDLCFPLHLSDCFFQCEIKVFTTHMYILSAFKSL